MNPAVRLGRWKGSFEAACMLAWLGAALICPASLLAADPPQVAWELLEPGLELGTAVPPIASDGDDPRIRILRVDPARFELQLLNASAAPDGARYTAKEWSQRNGLVAAINASLYQTDHSTSVSLMKSRAHTNNPRLSQHNAVLLFDRLDTEVPPAQIVDRTCRDLAGVQSHYGSMVQSIRMVSCNRVNVWSQQPDKKWSAAALGMDQQGRVLLIHMRAPLSTHDLIESLLTLPLGLREAMYLEGGPEAQLYVNAGGREHEWVGSRGSSYAGIENVYALPIPNVVGVRRIAASAPAP